MINEPITEYKVVRDILQRCQQATFEVGQKYVITTFDLGVTMKAMPIIWDKPDLYRDHVVLIGSFHSHELPEYARTQDGRVWVRRDLEANLVTSGCLHGVLGEKGYSKSLWCLKVVSEALERLLFSAFFDELPNESHLKSTDPSTLDTLINSSTTGNLAAAHEDPALIQLIEAYTDFQAKVQNGSILAVLFGTRSSSIPAALRS